MSPASRLAGAAAACRASAATPGTRPSRPAAATGRLAHHASPHAATAPGPTTAQHAARAPHTRPHGLGDRLRRLRHIHEGDLDDAFILNRTEDSHRAFLLRGHEHDARPHRHVLLPTRLLEGGGYLLEGPDEMAFEGDEESGTVTTEMGGTDVVIDYTASDATPADFGFTLPKSAEEYSAYDFAAVVPESVIQDFLKSQAEMAGEEAPEPKPVPEDERQAAIRTMTFCPHHSTSAQRVWGGWATFPTGTIPIRRPR